jgi:hypothetical protein
VVMIVEKPAIESCGGDGVLEGGEIHRENDNAAWWRWASNVAELRRVGWL